MDSRQPIDVRQFTEHMMGIMKATIESGAYAIPMTFALRTEGRAEIIGIAGMAGEQEKNRAAYLLGVLRERPDVMCVVFLAEGYGKRFKEGELKKGEPLSGRVKDMPGRVECIIANVMERGAEPTSACWEYDRDPSGKPVFRQIEWMPAGSKVAGRFVPGSEIPPEYR